MNWATLIGAITSLLQHRSTKPVGIALLLLFTSLCVTQIYAKLAVSPTKIEKLETRVTDIEKGDISTNEQLKAINSSLQRIETMTTENRRDMSELKVALINKR